MRVLFALTAVIGWCGAAQAEVVYQAAACQKADAEQSPIGSIFVLRAKTCTLRIPRDVAAKPSPDGTYILRGGQTDRLPAK